MDTEDMIQNALLMHRDGDIAGAEKLYRQILSVEPAHAAAALNLASIALDRDQLGEAAARLQGIIARNEDDGLAHLLYSRALFRLQRHTEGEQHIRAAFELLPEDDVVSTEYVSALRRRYFTFNSDEYVRLLSAAQEGRLEEPARQRLAQLALFRILRPELLRLIVEPGLPQGTPDAVSRWLLALPEAARADLITLARNFAQAVELMQDSPRFAPQRATLTLRKGAEGAESELQVKALEDADTLTGATLELVTEGELRFLPFAEIRSIEFSQPAAAQGVLATMRDGTLRSGLMPLFYLFTEFAENDKVRQGTSTLVRPVVPGASVGVGIRALRADEGFIPVVRMERIDFEVTP